MNEKEGQRKRKIKKNVMDGCCNIVELMKNCENLLPLLIKENDEQYILLPDCSSNVSKVNYNRRKLQYLSGQKVKMMMIIIDRNEIIRKVVVMVSFFSFLLTTPPSSLLV